MAEEGASTLRCQQLRTACYHLAHSNADDQGIADALSVLAAAELAAIMRTAQRTRMLRRSHGETCTTSLQHARRRHSEESARLVYFAIGFYLDFFFL